MYVIILISHIFMQKATIVEATNRVITIRTPRCSAGAFPTCIKDGDRKIHGCFKKTTFTFKDSLHAAGEPFTPSRDPDTDTLEPTSFDCKYFLFALFPHSQFFPPRLLQTVSPFFSRQGPPSVLSFCIRDRSACALRSIRSLATERWVDLRRGKARDFLRVGAIE